MGTNDKIRKEITFNSTEEINLYNKFKVFCKLRGINETSAMRESLFLYMIVKEQINLKSENKNEVKIDL